MTKAKARLRAKAKSAQKAKKRETNTNQSGPKARLGQFDPGPNLIKGAGMSLNIKSIAGTKRGPGRSR
jgi:hypothetical protein